MGLGSTCVDIMSYHGYGPIDTGLQGLLNPKKSSKKGDHNHSVFGGLDRPTELQEILETSPQTHVVLLGKMGRKGQMEKFPQLALILDLKIKKVYLLKIQIKIQTQVEVQ